MDKITNFSDFQQLQEIRTIETQNFVWTVQPVNPTDFFLKDGYLFQDVLAELQLDNLSGEERQRRISQLSPETQKKLQPTAEQNYRVMRETVCTAVLNLNLVMKYPKDCDLSKEECSIYAVPDEDLQDLYRQIVDISQPNKEVEDLKLFRDAGTRSTSENATSDPGENGGEIRATANDSTVSKREPTQSDRSITV